MKIDLMPLKRPQESSHHSPKVRMFLDLLIAGAAFYTFQNRHKWSNAPLVGRIAQIGGGALLLLGAGEAYITATPPKKTPPSIKIPPLQAYYEQRIQDEHPYKRTTFDLKGKSPLAAAGIVSPAKETLETYKNWFEKAKTLGIEEGAYYYYPLSEKSYRLHILTKEGIREEETTCTNFPSLQKWIENLGTLHQVNPTPINYALLVDMQNHIVTKFGGKGESSDTDYKEPSIGIDSPKTSVHNLSEKPLQNTFILRGTHQGLGRDFTIYLSPYSIWLKDQNDFERLCDLSMVEETLDLEIGVVSIPDAIIEAICTKLEPTLQHMKEEPSEKKKSGTWTRKMLIENKQVQALKRLIENYSIDHFDR